MESGSGVSVSSSMRDWLGEEARLAKVEELCERTAIQRRAASTEPDPTKRKRKLTRASRSEEKADSMITQKSIPQP